MSHIPLYIAIYDTEHIELISNPIEHAQHADRVTGGDVQIVYVPLHVAKAAPALLAACEAAFERLTDNDMIGLGSYALAEQIRAALALVKGE